MKTWLKRSAGLLASMALLWWFASGGYFTEVQGRLSLLGWHEWTVAALAFGATYLLRAARIFDELRHQFPMRFSAVLRLTLIHNASVNIMPFRTGEAAFPILLSRWFDVPVTRAVAALLWLRLQDAFVVLALAAFAWPGLDTGLRLLWVCAVLLAAQAVPMWAKRHRAELEEVGLKPGLLQKLRVALAESTRAPMRGWLWSVANWSVKLTAQAWLLSVLVGASFLSGLAGAMGVELAAILPIQGVAGFGTYEAGGAALLRPHGIMLEDGLQAALALHLFVISCALISGLVAFALPAPARQTE